MTKLIPLILVLVSGCGADPEVERLRRELAAAKEENEALRMSLPSERPAVLKDLDVAKETVERLRKELVIKGQELAVAKTAAEKANSQVPQELMPLAAFVMDLKKRVAELEGTASRKGHTHEYEDKYPVGTVHSRTRTTEPDKEK